ncbi:MAG: 23S rRNA (uracil(1939)-C(5))-methyltransferase RlmD, partial [Bacillota bacterium]|nr:23S rRNA (uracil(1939)-C(5))-methyltransferase RlmD [Bacillota bacterium]
MDIEKGKTYVIEINGMNHEGQGVGRYNGFTVFVDGALKGEKVEVQISELKKSYAVGKLLNIIEVSKDRIEPTCPGYERCGGCSFQHMNYKGQLEFKTDIVRESLKRIGKLEDVQVHPVVGMDNPFNYRNKVQFPVGMSEGIPVMGFYARRTHEIVDNSDCGIQDPDSSKVRKIVLDFIKEYKISVYDEKTGKGLLRHVMVRKGFKTGEIM